MLKVELLRRYRVEMSKMEITKKLSLGVALSTRCKLTFPDNQHPLKIVESKSCTTGKVSNQFENEPELQASAESSRGTESLPIISDDNFLSYGSNIFTKYCLPSHMVCN